LTPGYTDEGTKYFVSRAGKENSEPTRGQERKYQLGKRQANIDVGGTKQYSVASQGSLSVLQSSVKGIIGEIMHGGSSMYSVSAIDRGVLVLFERIGCIYSQEGSFCNSSNEGRARGNRGLVRRYFNTKSLEKHSASQRLEIHHLTFDIPGTKLPETCLNLEGIQRHNTKVETTTNQNPKKIDSFPFTSSQIF
jgi:hypothetical protein